MANLVRVRLDLAYDGSGFAGVAPNVGVTTVDGELAAALETVLGAEVDLTFAGRTDKGVHALGQVATFDAPAPIDAERLVRSVNAVLGGAVVVRRAVVTEPDFDARFSARWRRYRYSITNSPTADPLHRHDRWWIPEPLALAPMRAAAVPLVGVHDFAAFCRRPKPTPGHEHAPSLVRQVVSADWAEPDDDGLLAFDIVATAFCHQMVRALVGTLVDVGRGRLTAAQVATILRSRDRSAASNLAPPHGLCLMEVGY